MASWCRICIDLVGRFEAECTWETGRKSLSKNPNRGATAVKSSSVVLFPQQPALQLIYDTAPIGLACPFSGLPLSADQPAPHRDMRHLGRGSSGTLGRDCVPALADAVEGIVRSIMDTGDPVTGIEVAGQRADQTEERSWITYWHPLRSPSGEIVAVNVAAEEITERKRAEAALQASERETAQRQGCGRSRVAQSAGDPELPDRSGKTRSPRAAGGRCRARDQQSRRHQPDRGLVAGAQDGRDRGRIRARQSQAIKPERVSRDQP